MFDTVVKQMVATNPGDSFVLTFDGNWSLHGLANDMYFFGYDEDNTNNTKMIKYRQ